MIIKSGFIPTIFSAPGPWHYAILNLDTNINFFEVSDWCLDNFGIDGINWVSGVDRSSYFFKKEEDLTLFILRWT